jgi:hypothetical protein
MIKLIDVLIKRILFNITKIILLFLLSSGYAGAQIAPSQEIMLGIIRDTIRSDGALTHKMHEQFWQQLRYLPAKEKNEFLRVMNFSRVEQYQIEAWDSALLSYRNHKVVKTGKLISLEAEIQEKTILDINQSLSGIERQTSIKEFDTKYRAAIANTNRLLEAAANRMVLEIPGRASFDMSESNIINTRASIKDGFVRLSQLLNPVWNSVQ